jgi:hypothetical membrane protein
MHKAASHSYEVQRRYRRAALIAGIVAIMGIITAEATYLGYCTAQNDISDLGATRPPNSIIKQPAATIFGATLLAAGLL